MCYAIIWLTQRFGGNMGIAEVITVFAIVATNLGTVILLHTHQDAKTNAILQAIQQEMKDFHGRLCAIEERNKK